MRPTSDGATVEPTVDRQRRGAGQLISLGVALTLAGVLLYYSLRGIEWRQVASIIAGAKAWLLTVAAAISTTSILLRAIRWRVLLSAEGNVRVPTAFWATAAGYFGNNFLPARAGELVRTLMISSRSGLDTAYVLATAPLGSKSDSSGKCSLRSRAKAAWHQVLSTETPRISAFSL